MTDVGTKNKKRLVSRTLLVAEAFALCIASTSALAAIIDSGPVNIPVPDNIDGVYLNVVTGLTGTTAASVPGYDFNPYSSTGSFAIFWCASATACGGVVAAATTTPLLVLAPGATISAASTFTRTVAAASSFRVTQDAFLGFRFVNENTGATNYGYARLTTTAATGFPATIVSYSYDDTGAAITIPVPSGANLGIVKSDGQTIAEQGSVVTYTITASNAGPNATTATVTDTIPAGLEQCVWACQGTVGTVCAVGPVNGNISDAVTLPNGSSITYTLQCTIAAAALGDIVNSASIQGVESDPTPADNSGSDTTTAVPRNIFGDGFEEPVVTGH